MDIKSSNFSNKYSCPDVVTNFLCSFLSTDEEQASEFQAFDNKVGNCPINVNWCTLSVNNVNERSDKRRNVF